MALVTAGLFSAQTTMAQSTPTAAPEKVSATATPAPVCTTVDIKCLTTSLTLSADQVTKMNAIQRQYSSECAAITASKISTSVMAQKVADLQKKRDLDLRAVLTREQSPKWDAAYAKCPVSKPAAVPATTTAPAAK